jgi:hypothetical protein
MQARARDTANPPRKTFLLTFTQEKLSWDLKQHGQASQVTQVTAKN